MRIAIIVLGLLCFLATAAMSHASQEQKAWTAKETTIFKGHGVPVRTAALSPDGRILASAGDDRREAELKLWDTATGKELPAPPAPKGYVNRLIFSGDGRRLLVSGSSGRSTVIWDIQDQAVLAAHDDSRGGGPSMLALNHDGSRYATAGYRSMGLWESKSGNSVKITQSNQFGYSNGAFTPDLKYYAFGNSQDIDLWDVMAGKELKIFGEHRGVVKCVAFSEDAKTLIAASVRSTGYYQWIGQVKFWDIATGKDRWTLAPAMRHVTALALSPDEKTLALLDWPEIDENAELVLVDVTANKEILRLKESAQRFVRPIFIDNNKLLVVGIAKDKTLRLWEASR